ncbi:Phosphoribosylamine--glycine ligase [bacterium HR19]|nr:Phosphoribosylamine--glycine ligase [bacterium HR19]
MRVLVLGGGGREHAIGWRLKKDYKEGEFFFAPGNAGTEKIGINLSINPEDPYEVASICAELKIDFIFVGPENPLAKGVVDILTEEGRLCFGPTKKGAMLESSKVFAKKIMEEAQIPTAKFSIYSIDDFKTGKLKTDKLTPPVVIKASGLCAGKGTFVCKTKEQIDEAIRRIFVEREFGDEGNQIVVEEFLDGKEISYFALCVKNQFKTIGFAKDYKRLLDGDEGPNTGGMGSYSPVEYGDEKLREKVENKIIKPLMKKLTEKEIEFTGILYAGLMIGKDGEPYVLEFNTRLGDPEAQVILPLIKNNFFEVILKALSEEKIEDIKMENHALCVVMSSEGYPSKYKKGTEINIKNEEGENFIIFHAGTKRENSKLISSGGRVLNIVGIGKSKDEARKIAYDIIEREISFPNSHFRKDIGL